MGKSKYALHVFILVSYNFYLYSCMFYNSLRPSDAHIKSSSPLVQIMACNLCSAKPLSETMLECCYWNKLQGNLNENSYIFIQENASENVTWKKSAIFSWPQCDKKVQYNILWHSVLKAITAPFMGELWGVYCEDFGENYNGTTMYFPVVFASDGLLYIAVQRFTLDPPQGMTFW